MTLNCIHRVISLPHPGANDLSCWSAVKTTSHSHFNKWTSAVDCWVIFGYRTDTQKLYEAQFSEDSSLRIGENLIDDWPTRSLSWDWRPYWKYGTPATGRSWLSPGRAVRLRHRGWNQLDNPHQFLEALTCYQKPQLEQEERKNKEFCRNCVKNELQNDRWGIILN